MQLSPVGLLHCKSISGHGTSRRFLGAPKKYDHQFRRRSEGTEHHDRTIFWWQLDRGQNGAIREALAGSHDRGQRNGGGPCHYVLRYGEACRLTAGIDPSTVGSANVGAVGVFSLTYVRLAPASMERACEIISHAEQSHVLGVAYFSFPGGRIERAEAHQLSPRADK